MSYEFHQADCLEWLRSQPSGLVDLVFTSPPYESARTYGIDFTLKGQEFVDWCVERYIECLRVCKGLVAWVIEGQTRQYRYSAVPALLMADLHRRGVHLRKPPIFHRIGIPGSGGPDWLRNDYEFIVCATNGGKLPWSDNTAMGHPPKWAPGGEMSHRVSNGSRVNQWGHPIGSGATVTDSGGRVRSRGKRPSHELAANHKQHTKTKANGEMEVQTYIPPTLANPGNVISNELHLVELIDIFIDYEQATNSTTDQVLRALRQADSNSSLCEWFYGVCLQVEASSFLLASLCPQIPQAAPNSAVFSVQQSHSAAAGRSDSGIQPAEVLQPQMPRQSDGETGRAEARRSSAPRSKDSSPTETTCDLREMLSDEATGSTPPRSGCDKQLAEQFGSIVSVVPPQRAQNYRLQSRRMYESTPIAGLLQQTLPKIQEVWRSIDSRFRKISNESGSIIRCLVGGGVMGSPLSHLNEAPMPASLCEFFIRSFCPPKGKVLDPFSGSGTTIAVAARTGRHGIGIDVRLSQVELGQRRCREIQRELI